MEEKKPECQQVFDQAFCNLVVSELADLKRDVKEVLKRQSWIPALKWSSAILWAAMGAFFLLNLKWHGLF
jgi:hypothetical protein